MKKLILSLIILLNFGLIIDARASDIQNNYEIENIQTKEEIEYEIDIEQEIQKSYKKQISVNTEFVADLTDLIDKLKILNPENDFIIKWELSWTNTQKNWPVFKRTFSEKWEKELNLSLYQKSNEPRNSEPQLILNRKLNILVFEKSLPIIFSNETNKIEIQNYLDFAKKDGIYVYQIWPFNDKSEIELSNILAEIEKYEKIPWLKSDYLTIWWNRDFLFNLLSKLNRELSLSWEKSNTIKYNIVAISQFNINVLEWYVQNFLADKNWINKIILANEDSKFLILKENLISSLEDKLKENNYKYIDINLKLNKVNEFFIISKFINNLSNAWYSTNNIYLFLIIPLILTAIVFSKHFIWISPIWIMVPLFITLMFLKLWYFISLFLIITFVWLNLALSIFIERHNLLYGPKMTFSLIINLFLFIVVLNIWVMFNLINLDLNDIMFFIMFIVVCERFINILVSKDIWEYKMPFVYTILVASICYLVLNLPAFKLIVLSFPELLLALIPINFLIWRFTWLRVTEYFRFKEIIKTVEE